MRSIIWSFCKRANVKFGFWLFMREYLTTSDIGRMCGGYTAQQVRNWWNDGDDELSAAVLNPGGKQLRFRKTHGIENYCANKAVKTQERAAKRKIRQSRFWTQYHRDLLGRLVERKQPRRHCDLIAFRMWKDLSVKNRLTIDELNVSVKRGVVTRIKLDEGSGSAGVSTLSGAAFQFKLYRQQIGENWSEWLPEEKAQVRDKIRPIVEFYNQLGQ